MAAALIPPPPEGFIPYSESMNKKNIPSPPEGFIPYSEPTQSQDVYMSPMERGARAIEGDSITPEKLTAVRGYDAQRNEENIELERERSSQEYGKKLAIEAERELRKASGLTSQEQKALAGMGTGDFVIKYAPKTWTTLQKNIASQSMSKATGLPEFQEKGESGYNVVGAFGGGLINSVFDTRISDANFVEAIFDYVNNQSLIGKGSAALATAITGEKPKEKERTTLPTELAQAFSDTYRPIELRQKMFQAQQQGFNNPEYWGASVGQMTEYIGEMVIGAKAGKELFRLPEFKVPIKYLGSIGIDTAGIARMAMLEAGNNRQQYLEYGIDPEIASEMALYTGPIAGLLEQDVTRSRKDALIGSLLKSSKKRSPIGTIISGIVEILKQGGEEYAQGLTGNLGLMLAAKQQADKYGAEFVVNDDMSYSINYKDGRVQNFPRLMEGVLEQGVTGSGAALIFKILGLPAKGLRYTQQIRGEDQAQESQKVELNPIETLDDSGIQQESERLGLVYRGKTEGKSGEVQYSFNDKSNTYGKFVVEPGQTIEQEFNRKREDFVAKEQEIQQEKAKLAESGYEPESVRTTEPESKLEVDKDIDYIMSIPETTGKKAASQEVRQVLGADKPYSPQRKEFNESLKKAIKRKLPEKSVQLAQKVLSKPRVLSDEEHSGMVYRMAQLKLEYKRNVRSLKEKMKTGFESENELAILSQDIADIESDFVTISDALLKTGTEASRALSIRRLMLDEEMDILSVKARATSKKGAKLTEAETKQFEKITSQLEESQKKITEMQKTIDALKATSVLTDKKSNQFARMDINTKKKSREAVATRIKELIDLGCNN